MKRKAIIYGADTVGWAVLPLLLQIGYDVLGFVDYKHELIDTKLAGLPVYNSLQIPRAVNEALFVIAIMNIKAAIDNLERQGIRTWIEAGTLLCEVDTRQDNPDYVIDEEKYLIESCKIIHSENLFHHVYLRSLDVMITERCSLKCRDCSNLMQYFSRPRDYDIDTVIESVRKLLPNVDRILEARVLGGDAFMHPSWPYMVKFLCAQEKIDRVIVYTNGVIVPKDLTALQHPKVIVAITNYGWLSKRLDALKYLFSASEIWHRVVEVTDWVDCGKIRWHYRLPDENSRIFQECVANNLITLADGKLFRCPYAASAHMLGAVKDDLRDYVDVDSAGKVDIYNYAYHKPQAMTACGFCDSRILTNKIPPAVQTEKPLPYERVR